MVEGDDRKEHKVEHSGLVKYLWDASMERIAEKIKAVK